MTIGHSWIYGGGVAAAFNGGKSQVNPNFLASGGDYPFINVLKWAPTNPYWTMNSNVSAPPPDILNADGYPTDLSTTGGGVNVQMFIADQVEKPGNWKVTWDGNGTISIGSNATIGTVSGSLTSTTGSGSYTFSMSTVAVPYIQLSITALTGPIITNIKVYNVVDETDLLAGKIFTSQFINKLIDAKFGVFRFMNWFEINQSNATTWAYRKQPSYFSWRCHQYPPELYVGVTANAAGTAYTGTVLGTLKHSSDGTTWNNGDAPKQGDTITIRWNNTQSTAGTYTYKLGTGGSSSAITIVEPGCTGLSSAGNNTPLNNRLATMTYDADLNFWMKWGGDLALFDYGIDNGIPYEALVELCTRVGCHPWICFPAYGVDPMTDYVPQALTYLKTNLPWAIPRIESQNEVWNPQFFTTQYGGAKSNAHWGSSNFHEWLGKTNSTIGQAASTVYGGGLGTRYHMCAAVQTTTGNTFASAQTSNPRLTSAAYVAQAAAPQSPYTKSAASGWVSHATIANYTNGAYGVCIYNSTQTAYETTLVNSANPGTFTITSCSGGNLVVASNLTGGGWAPASGMTIVGPNMAPDAGVTITGGVYPNFTISDAARTFVGGTQLYAYASWSPIQNYIDTLNTPWTGTCNIAGTTLTVTATSSPTSGLGSLMTEMVLHYNDVSCFNNNPINALGTGTGGLGTYTLNVAPGNLSGIAVTAFWTFDQTALGIAFANWKQWAQAQGVQKMNFYEGGYSPNYTQNGTGQYDVLRYLSKFVLVSTNNATGLQGYLTSNYALAAALSTGGFLAEFPSCFQLSGAYPSNNTWAVLEDIYQPTASSPQWLAIKAFNQ